MIPIDIDNLVEEVNNRLDNEVEKLSTIFINTIDEVLQDGGAVLSDDDFDDVLNKLTFSMVVMSEE